MKLFQISQPGTNLPTNASNSPEFANKHLIILALQTQPPFLQKRPFVTLHLTFLVDGKINKIESLEQMRLANEICKLYELMATDNGHFAPL